MKENGRPSKFEQVKDMLYKMASYGMTDKQMADVVGVSEQTVNNWKLKDPNFLESLKAEKEIADARVERSLFERATGYSHAEDKIFNDNGTPLVVPTVKHYAPDTTAAIFWLKNRKPKEWRDKQDIEHSGEVSQVVIVDDISKLKR
jgi:DNA-binding XRE family transcriptional regulator